MSFQIHPRRLTQPPFYFGNFLYPAEQTGWTLRLRGRIRTIGNWRSFHEDSKTNHIAAACRGAGFLAGGKLFCGRYRAHTAGGCRDACAGGGRLSPRCENRGYSKGLSGRQSGPARHAHPRAGARDAGPRVRRTARAGRRSCPHGGRHAGLFRRARVGRRGAFARAFFRYRRRRSGRTAAS